jgi:DNA-binding response OmpR family regulator
MTNGVVLVIASDAAIGALLGALAETSGYSAVYPTPLESVADAVARLEPSVVLLDGDDDRSAESRFYRSASAVGSRVVLFSSSRGRDETERMAALRGLPALTLPVGPRAFRQVIAGLFGDVRSSAGVTVTARPAVTP